MIESSPSVALELTKVKATDRKVKFASKVKEDQASKVKVNAGMSVLWKRLYSKWKENQGDTKAAKKPALQTAANFIGKLNNKAKRKWCVFMYDYDYVIMIMFCIQECICMLYQFRFYTLSLIVIVFLVSLWKISVTFFSSHVFFFSFTLILENSAIYFDIYRFMSAIYLHLLKLGIRLLDVIKRNALNSFFLITRPLDIAPALFRLLITIQWVFIILLNCFTRLIITDSQWF